MAGRHRGTFLQIDDVVKSIVDNNDESAPVKEFHLANHDLTRVDNYVLGAPE
jgi:hypothetical protein